MIWHFAACLPFDGFVDRADWAGGGLAANGPYSGFQDPK
jgi:hypothetical protein